MSNTEVNQINKLIKQKEDEIANLKEFRKDFENDDEDVPRSSAEVAQDAEASQEERAAAANATAHQDPADVFTAQSEPTPAEKEADQEANRDPEEAKQEREEEAEEIKQEQNDDSETDDATEEQGRIPDGRGDPNDLANQDPITPGDEVQVQQTADATNEAVTAKEKGDEAKDESKSKKTAQKSSKKGSSKKGSSKKKS